MALGNLSYLHKNQQPISGSLPIFPYRNFEIISAEIGLKGKEFREADISV